MQYIVLLEIHNEPETQQIKDVLLRYYRVGEAINNAAVDCFLQKWHIAELNYVIARIDTATRAQNCGNCSRTNFNSPLWYAEEFAYLGDPRTDIQAGENYRSG